MFVDTVATVFSMLISPLGGLATFVGHFAREQPEVTKDKKETDQNHRNDIVHGNSTSPRLDRAKLRLATI
jgi:hypothetical protein